MLYRTFEKHDNYNIVKNFLNNKLVLSFYNYKMPNGQFKYDFNTEFELDENDIIFSGGN
jgi:hypothetical protein